MKNKEVIDILIENLSLNDYIVVTKYISELEELNKQLLISNKLLTDKFFEKEDVEE